jgi:N-acetyl-D-muramate 6-phosphate phosphatase
MLEPAPLKAVLFDLDGTLIDTAPDFHALIAQMLITHNCPPISYEEFRRCVSDGARGMIKTAFKCAEDDPRFESLRQELLALYTDHIADYSQLFPGIAPLLKYIESENMQWGIATNKPCAFAEPLLAALSLAERCAVLVCPDHVRNRKPHPEALYLACEKIGAGVNEAIYVGDHRRDIESARNAQMPSIACTYGYVHADDPCETWGADFIVHRADQIIPILQNWIY